MPVYNEKEIVGTVITKLKTALKKYKKAAEIIIVNDGSDDGTTAVLKKIQGIRIINHAYNMGNGAAVKTGIRNARGEFVALMDSDGQHDPNDIIRLVRYLPEYDMVVGARMKKSKKRASLHRNFANSIYNMLATYLTNRKIVDLTSGFRIFKRAIVIKFVSLLPNGFSYPTTITLTVIRAGYAVRYEPIFVDRRVGKSKIRPFHDGVKFILIMLRIITLYSPMKIFLPISILILLGSIGHGLWRVFYLSSSITNTTLTLFITSILIFLLGLISEQINQIRIEKMD